MSQQARDFSTFAWPGLLKHLRQMLIADTPMEEGIDWAVKTSSSDFSRSVANQLVLRGCDAGEADVTAFNDPLLYPSWLPHRAGLQTWRQTRALYGHDKSALLLSNGQLPVSVLDATVGRAWSMFAARAFIHQYQQYGLTEEDFVDSFSCLEQVLATYKGLS